MAGSFNVSGYVGDGAATQRIVLPFPPRMVWVFPQTQEIDGQNPSYAYVKLENMTGLYSYEVCTGTYYNDSIRTLNTSGFIVGDGTGAGTNLNQASSGYVFAASA